MNKTHERKCLDCGRPIPLEAPAGFCPHCEMAGAIALSPIADAAHPAFGQTLRYFGDYELLDEIARGGMGVVYKARQISLNRTVAVKMILTERRPMAVEVNRFRASTRAAAGLQHPNIVPIYEIGEQDGHDYFSMEFVEGPNLAQVVRDNPLPASRAAGYIRIIAEAVHYAHERGILHRDLKPSNILLDSLDQPRVTDFGLAKNLSVDPELTEAGQVLGAPSFIPPEQAAGLTEEVGRHSDVYALGAILYHLLTGRPPFLAESLQATLAQVVQSEPISLRTLNASVPADLETICLKCLEKAPSRRYRTAQELADELGHFLRGEPISARPVSKFEKAWRWGRRNPALAASLGAAAILLVTIAVVSAVAAWRISAARNADREHLVRLKVAAGWQMVEQGQWFDALAPFAEALELDRGDARREQAHKTRIAMLLQTGPQLRRVWFPGGPLTHIELSRDGLRVLTATASWKERTNQAAAQIWDLQTGKALTPPMLHAGRINFATFSPDGNLVITASEDKTAQVWNAASGTPLGPPLLHTAGVAHAAFSPDGKWVATCTPNCPSDSNGYVYVWNPLTGASPLHEPTSGMDAQLVLFSPDSRKVLVGSKYFHCNQIDLNTKQGMGVADCWEAFAGAFSPDGNKILIAGAFGHNFQPGARLFDSHTWKALTPLLSHSDRPALVAAFSPDARVLATGGADRTARLWDANTGEATVPPLIHEGPVSSIEFSPDGRKLLTSSRDGTARVWDTESGLRVYPPIEHDGPVCQAFFASNGQDVVTGCEDGAVRVWALVSTPPAQRAVFDDAQVSCARFSPDGRWIATGDSGGNLQIWDVSTLKPVFTRMPHTSGITSIKFSINGRRVLVLSEDWSAHVWDLSGHEPQSMGQRQGKSADFDSDGSRVVSSDLYDHILAQMWEAKTGESIGSNFLSLVHDADADFTERARFSPDGHWIGLTHTTGRVEIWDAVSLKRVLFTLVNESAVNNLWFSQDSSRIVTVSDDNTARIWDRQTGLPLSPPLHHTGPVKFAAFSPNGNLLVTGSDDATARLWTCPGGKLIGAPMLHHDAVNEACFSPDGRKMATASSDGTARIWDTETAEALTPPLVHAGKVWTVNFSPDGRWLLTASEDQSARLWRVPEEHRPFADLQSEVRVMAGVSTGTTNQLALEQAWSKVNSSSTHTPQDADQAADLFTDSLSAELPALLLGLQRVEKEGNFAKSVLLLNRLNEFAQENWLLLFRRAYAKAHLADYSGAVEDYTLALHAEPNATVCWLGRYLVRSAQGDTNATADLREALQRARGFRVQGNIPLTAQVTPADPSLPDQWETVARECSAGLGSSPQTVSLLCARGVAEAAQLRWTTASADFEQATNLQPTLEDSWLALALTYSKLADRDETLWPRVLRASEQALTCNPGDPMAQSLQIEAVRKLKPK